MLENEIFLQAHDLFPISFEQPIWVQNPLFDVLFGCLELKLGINIDFLLDLVQVDLRWVYPCLL